MFARVKFLSRLLTAFNLLLSIATLAFVQQAHPSIKRDELDANLTDRRPVIFAEIGNRFVIRAKPAREPHDTLRPLSPSSRRSTEPD